MSTSLVGNLMHTEKLIGSRTWMPIAQTTGGSYSNKKKVDQVRNPIDEHSDDSLESDPDTKELDEYLTRRLEQIEESKMKKQREKEVKIVSASTNKKSKHKHVVDEDSQYEYVLESEEEEDEWNSKSDTSAERIFTNSFVRENNKPTQDVTRTNVQNKKYLNPMDLVSKTTKSNKGSTHQLRAKRQNYNEALNTLEIEERKEESYVHPSLDNSAAFSNISAIFGQHALNNIHNNTMSFQEDSFSRD
jgi:hypothetical protein